MPIMVFPREAIEAIGGVVVLLGVFIAAENYDYGYSKLVGRKKPENNPRANSKDGRHAPPEPESQSKRCESGTGSMNGPQQQSTARLVQESQSLPPEESMDEAPVASASKPNQPSASNLVQESQALAPTVSINVPPVSSSPKLIVTSAAQSLSPEESVDGSSVVLASKLNQPSAVCSLKESQSLAPEDSMNAPLLNSSPKLILSGAALGGAMVVASPIVSYTSDSATSIKNHMGLIPPLCKELVLPHCEAYFAVAFSQLDSVTNGDFDIFGLSGKPLLRASMQTGPNLRKLRISMKPQKSPTLGSIEVERNEGKLRMQIRAKSDEHYGYLTETEVMHFVLTTAQSTTAEVATVWFDRSKNQIILTPNEATRPLACASRCGTDAISEIFEGVPYLEVRADPGFDAVLSLLCMMGIVLFAASPSLS